MLRLLILILSLLPLAVPRAAAQRIAIISDPHIQDVAGHPELVRSWESQAQSTRLFNENYFAFLAALDDAARRGIRLVILPGDLTDNGQQLTCQAVTRILHSYERRFGMRFFMTTGNHDPNYPVGMHWGQKDFLSADGHNRVIYSDSCSFFLANKPAEVLTPDTVVPGLRCLGYDELVDEWRDFGFMTRSDFSYWERPDNPTTFPDASYLAEPEPGLWLLAIDGSVHTPREHPLGPYRWNGSWPGYNNVLRHKPYLVEWVRSVADRARRQGKRLVVFSHYPMVDFNNGTTDLIAKAWGEKAFDLTRVPLPDVAKAFFDAGLRLHIAGHMHINQVGIWHPIPPQPESKADRRAEGLVNVQVPSTSGYCPAYKILTIENDSIYDFQTVTIDSVPGFDVFFPRYGQNGTSATTAKDYPAFCRLWFSELVARRFVRQDLPEALQQQLFQLGGTYLSAADQTETDPDSDAPAQPSSHKRTKAETLRWNGLDLVTDFYRLRFAGESALADIPPARLQAYLQAFPAMSADPQLRVLADAFRCMLAALPTNHFRVNVRTGEIITATSSAQ